MCNYTFSRYDNFINCYSAEKMPVRKYFCFNFGVIKIGLKSLYVAVLIYHEECIQTSASGNPEGFAVQLTASYQREDECRVFCRILTAYIHTVLE